MRLIPRLFAAAVMAAAAVSCSSTPPPAATPDTSKDIAAIGTVRGDYAAAYSSGDVTKLMTLYAPDAVMMQQHQPAVVGAENIRKSVEATFAQVSTAIKIAADETKVMGDMAFDRGTYTLTITPKAPGAAPTTENGKYLVLLTKGADGAWKLAREIGNTSDPMPPPAAAPMAAKKK